LFDLYFYVLFIVDNWLTACSEPPFTWRLSDKF
jgi:hypothetical protein